MEWGNKMAACVSARAARSAAKEPRNKKHWKAGRQD